MHGILKACLLECDAVIFVSPVARERAIESVSVRLLSAPAPSVPLPVAPAVAKPRPEPRVESRPVDEPERAAAVVPPPIPVVAESDPIPADPRREPASFSDAASVPVDVAAASPTPPAAPDAKSDPRDLWVQQVRSQILEQKRYPALARRRDIEGVVEAHVSIDEEGNLTTVRIVDGAPRVLALAAERAVVKAAPFPAPPFGATILQLPIDYTLVR